MRNPTTGLASLYRGVTLEWITGLCLDPHDLAIAKYVATLPRVSRRVSKRQLTPQLISKIL